MHENTNQIPSGGAAVQIVLDWLEAANTQNTGRLLELSDPEIELCGPRGSSYGHLALGEWLARAGLNLTTRQIFGQEDRVVVAQQAVWRTPGQAEITGQQELASYFRVAGNRVVYFRRFDDLEAALQAAGLTDFTA